MFYSNRDTEECLSFQTGTWRSIVQSLPKSIKIDGNSIEGAFVDCGLYTQLCHSYTSLKNPYILLLDNGQEVTRFLAKPEMIVIDQIIASIEKRMKFMILERENKNKPKKVAKNDEIYEVASMKEFNALSAADDSGFVFVKFFAPWCGHCKKLEPSWLQLSKEMNSKDAKTNPDFAKNGNWPKISRVDCTAEDLQDVCKHQNIKGYPTLRLFHNGVQVTDFSGQRQLDFLKRWLLLQIVKADPLKLFVKYDSNNIGVVTAPNFKTFASPIKPKSHALLYFYTPWCQHCKEIDTIWETLAKFTPNSHLNLGKLDCTEHRQICIDQGVQGYPAFMMYQDGRILGKYTGKRSVEDFGNFINEFVNFELVEKQELDENDASQCTMEKKDNCADETSEKLIESGNEVASNSVKNTIEPQSEHIQDQSEPLKTSSVQKITKLSEISKTTPTFVKFFTTGCPHCRNVAQTWKLLSTVNFNFDIIIGEVNCDENRDFCKAQMIKGLPTLRLFVDGELKEDYKGPRDIVNFSEWIEIQLGINENNQNENNQPKDEL